MTEDLLEKAIALALRAHRGQRDKGGHAYIRPPLRAMERASAEGAEAMIAAVLHDTIEDGLMTPDRLRERGLPAAVVDAVAIVTKRPEEKGGEEAYARFIERIAESGSRLAIVVKLADLADNLDVSRLARAPTAKDRARLARYEAAREQLRRALAEAAPP